MDYIKAHLFEIIGSLIPDSDGHYTYLYEEIEYIFKVDGSTGEVIFIEEHL